MSKHSHHWRGERVESSRERNKRDDEGRLLGRFLCKSNRHCHAGERWYPVSDTDRDFRDFNLETERVLVVMPASSRHLYWSQ